MIAATATPAFATSQWLMVVNVLLVLLIIGFSAGIAFALVRRSVRQRVAAERLAATGQATARILHQVKNPLQTVLLHAELLHDDRMVADPGERREIASAIILEAGRMNDLLAELSAFAAGIKRRIEPAPLALDELLRETVQLEARDGGREGVDVVVSALERATIAGDPYFLRQAIGNVLRNALEAMAEHDGGGPRRLEVGLRRRAGEARLEVKDTGPGLAPDQVATVFEPFVTTKSKGMGLGLPICREIVEAHGGRIELRSRLGAGTTVTMTFPVIPAREEDRAGAGALSYQKK
jgi:signal transduction histidine kinase